MTQDDIRSRRAFLKAGAVLAVPVAAGMPAAAALADGGVESRLARREDETAIRELHRLWLRRVNSGAGDTGLDPAIRSVLTDPAAEPDMIELAADGRGATGRFHCTVETVTEIAPDCTLAQMAHAQGEGFLRNTEQRRLDVSYVKSADGWTIDRFRFAAA